MGKVNGAEYYGLDIKDLLPILNSIGDMLFGSIKPEKKSTVLKKKTS